MTLPNWSVKNGAFVLVLTLIATAIGLLSYQGMPRSEDPSINIPTYLVTIVYPGTSPEDMEELVVDPLEKVIEDIDDINFVVTEIAEGLAVLRIEASYALTDWDEKGVEIERELNTVRDELPAGIVFYDFEQFKQEDRAVVHQIALTSPAAPFHELETIAESVEERLDGSRLTGIYCAGLPLDFNDFGHTPVSIKFDTMKTSTNMKVERFSDDEDYDSLYIPSNQDPATNWLGGEEQRFYSYNDFLHRIASSGNLAIELNFGDAGTHWIRFSLKGSRHALTTIAALPGSPPIRPLTPKQSQDSSDE